MKPLIEAVVDVARGDNARMTGASGSKTRKNLTEGKIMETIINFELMVKRGEITG